MHCTRRTLTRFTGPTVVLFPTPRSSRAGFLYYLPHYGMYIHDSLPLPSLESIFPGRAHRHIRWPRQGSYPRVHHQQQHDPGQRPMLLAAHLPRYYKDVDAYDHYRPDHSSRNTRIHQQGHRTFDARVKQAGSLASPNHVGLTELSIPWAFRVTEFAASNNDNGYNVGDVLVFMKGCRVRSVDSR